MKNDFLELSQEDNMALMKRYPDNYFDLSIVDPPYGIERFKKVTNKPSSKDVHAKRFQNMQTVNDTKPSKRYWDELFRVSNNQIIWGANNFTLPESEYFLIWDKKQAMPNFARCEYAWVSMGLKKPAKIFDYSIHKHNQVNKIHQTQKPISLYEWILLNYAKPNQKILDTHLGSMSIAIAVDRVNKMEGMNLHLTGCELDKEYFDKGIQRVSREISQTTIF